MYIRLLCVAVQTPTMDSLSKDGKPSDKAEESLEIVDLPTRIAHRIAEISIKQDCIVFGGLVRDYLREVPFDTENHDIDICTESVRTLPLIFGRNGIEFKRLTKHEAYPIEQKKPLKIISFEANLVNDLFFIGRKISVKIDCVRRPSAFHSFKDGSFCEPPFGKLDFDCNAWVWDKYGIRLSRNTGTYIDHLSELGRKRREIRLMERMSDMVTEYFPFDKEGDIFEMNDDTISQRKNRVKRILKMLERGWSIENIKIKRVELTSPTTCVICQDLIEGHGVTFCCCNVKYHKDCFQDMCVSELSTHVSIRCPQRCSTLSL